MGTSNVKFLKQMGVSERHIPSGFMIKKLHHCLILLISVNGGVLGCKSVTTSGRVVIWWMLQ
jgi:hypothetical protein